ncbi:hypothetical protein BCR32DRAFT_283378 [Anaeromyces robustus]|uniref:Uncharacterized protein n=1 Tax=Anaeromyces robustus TaxID=1754192 RepID=A0A1Y1WUN1_9FUNG|nr:hypothetical protein BCR32DRAFT_283378 [Anaeromyces robustus]|eukprot:ORX77261.1 hypothetical protein BCR32DRAFT_283378 [Anaeromyces robustus]
MVKIIKFIGFILPLFILHIKAVSISQDTNNDMSKTIKTIIAQPKIITDNKNIIPIQSKTISIQNENIQGISVGNINSNIPNQSMTVQFQIKTISEITNGENGNNIPYKGMTIPIQNNTIFKIRKPISGINKTISRINKTISGVSKPISNQNKIILIQSKIISGQSMTVQIHNKTILSINRNGILTRNKISREIPKSMRSMII